MAADRSLLAHARRLAAETSPELAFRAETADGWRAWRSALTERLRGLLGRWPVEPVALDPEFGPPVDAGGHTRERVTFAVEPGLRAPAYLLRPRRPSPEPAGAAVLALHGHGRGKDDVAGVAATPRERQRRVAALGYDYGARLADRGYVVLAPDARGFGEWAAADGMGCGWAASAALLLGRTLVGMRVHDAGRAIDLLTGLPDVDPGRVACVGLSWGGTLAMWTAALDERVAATVVSGAFGRFADTLVESDECPCQVVPGVLRVADIPDIAALVAPRPLLVQQGDADQHATPAVVREAFGTLRRAYGVAGAPDAVALDAHPGGHAFVADTALDWLDRRV